MAQDPPSLTIMPADSNTPTQRVLFVCEHGAAKSVFAASYFNFLAERENLNIRAVARGLDPDADVAESVRAGSEAEGIPLCAINPMQLTPDDVNAADKVVAFDLSSAQLGMRDSHQAWDGVPSLKQEFESGSTEIKARVEALVAELKTTMRDSL